MFYYNYFPPYLSSVSMKFLRIVITKDIRKVRLDREDQTATARRKICGPHILKKTKPHISALKISTAQYTGSGGGNGRTRICDLLHVKQAL